MPGFNLHTGNQLERLANALGEVVRLPLTNVFQPETIVVQSLGMARWLKLELTRRHGVCANVRFPFPRAFERQVFAQVLPERVASPLFDTGPMQWKIMRLLPELLALPGFEGPRHYLAGETDPRKCCQLAARIAGLFDQYLIYRPELIQAWDQGVDVQWQAVLWRELARGLTHPAALRRELEARLQSSDAGIAALPERVCIFGITTLPPFHVELFAALARHSDVHLFLLQPCREWWGEIVSARRAAKLLRQQSSGVVPAGDLHLERGHRLLASLGEQGREFLKLVCDHDAGGTQDYFIEPQSANLLGTLQSDILELRDRGGRGGEKAVVAGNDDSIQVHSCHSPLREMEVLHDHLLDWFARDAGLEPRDVLVMMPDLETYAPFIEAVFNAPESEARRIPFSIADRGARQRSQFVDTFLALLRLAGGRLGSAAVLALLDTEAVRARFDLRETDLPLVRDWIAQVNIRWGVDAEHRGGFGLPEFAGNTWREGLDRLLLGYALAGDDELFQGRLPHAGIEGTAALTLGRFVEFIDRLVRTLARLEQPRSLGEWADELRGGLAQFFQPDADAEREAQAIRDALGELARQARTAAFEEAVPLAVVLESLAPALEEDRSGAGYLSGSVTFCALKPMRSIPFQVICLVGMSDNTFPRATPQLSFDLMAQHPHPGDSSRREDDRYLFLETILSARRRLYLSYVGQSVQDNSEAPPAVLVSELLDCLAQGFQLAPCSRRGDEAEGNAVGGLRLVTSAATSQDEEARLRAHLVTRHRLQAFSADYFTGGRLFSYSEENALAARALQTRAGEPAGFAAAPISGPADDPDVNWREVRLDDLAEFFTNPAKFFLTRRLRLRFPDEQNVLEEREPFVLDGLQSYVVKQELLDARLASGDAHAAMARLAASGSLPPGGMGDAFARGLEAEVEAFLACLTPHLPAGPELEPVDVDMELAGFRLTGRFTRFAPQGQLHWRCATAKGKDRVRLWIHHVVWNAIVPAGHRGESLLVASDSTFRYEPVTDARAVLGELLAHYWMGLKSPLPFFPEASLAFAGARAADPAGDAVGAAMRKWASNDWSHVPGEQDDPCFQLCFPGLSLDDARFQTLATQVCAPLLAAERKLKQGDA